MQFKLNINCDNDSFEGTFGNTLATELESIMQVIPAKIACGISRGLCHDSNGNKVGSWEIVE